MRKPESFGEYVQLTREQRGMSGRQLAKRISVANSTIVHIEDGTIPKIEIIVELIDALELNPIMAMNFLAPYRRLYEQIVQQQDRSADHE